MNNITWDFNNKVVLVVGNTRGIGKSVFDKFNSAGADVFGINSSNCDISNKDDIDDYFEDLESVDILINIAAVNYTKKIENITLVITLHLLQGLKVNLGLLPCIKTHKFIYLV